MFFNGTGSVFSSGWSNLIQGYFVTAVNKVLAHGPRSLWELSLVDASINLYSVLGTGILELVIMVDGSRDF